MLNSRLILLFSLIFFSVTLSADSAIIFAFDCNMMPSGETLVGSSDFFSLPMSFCSGASTLFAFTLSGKKNLFFGPSGHDHLLKKFTFSFAGETGGMSFYDYSGAASPPSLNPESLCIFSGAVGLGDFYSVSSAYCFNETPEKSDNTNLALLRNLMLYFRAAEWNDFKSAYEYSLFIYRSLPDDEEALKMHLMSLMNNADFAHANAVMDSFYSKSDRGELYYSLKANLFAIWGKFDTAEKYIENGRELFPESRMLLRDAINLYSITDSLKMSELLDFYGNSVE